MVLGGTPILAPVTEVEKYWLAGLLEGEGSFMAPPPSSPNMPVVAMTTTDKDVADRVAEMFGTTPLKIADARYRKNGWKTAYLVRKRGAPAVELMRNLLPLMSKRRKGQIRKAVKGHRLRKIPKLTARDVREIKRRLDKGESQTSIARDFPVCRQTICQIANKQLYAAVAQR